MGQSNLFFFTVLRIKEEIIFASFSITFEIH